jgi:hypothetical protein
MTSGLPLTADIPRTSRHFAFVQKPDLRMFQELRCARPREPLLDLCRVSDIVDLDQGGSVPALVKMPTLGGRHSTANPPSARAFLALNG